MYIYTRFHIHLTILTSFLCSLITSYSLAFQVSLSYSKMLRTNVQYNVFAPKGKPLLANKDTNSLNLPNPLLIFVITLSTAPPLASNVPPR